MKWRRLRKSQGVAHFADEPVGFRFVAEIFGDGEFPAVARADFQIVIRRMPDLQEESKGAFESVHNVQVIINLKVETRLSGIHAYAPTRIQATSSDRYFPTKVLPKVAAGIVEGDRTPREGPVQEPNIAIAHDAVEVPHPKPRPDRKTRGHGRVADRDQPVCGLGPDEHFGGGFDHVTTVVDQFGRQPVLRHGKPD